MVGARGGISTVHTACASSGQALGEAFESIAYGDADLVVTGGADSMISPFYTAGFALLGALSKRNDAPKTASRPFDRERNGFVFSEGACFLVFEEYDHACKRGAPILSEVCGYGITQSAYRITDLHPEAPTPNPQDHSGHFEALDAARDQHGHISERVFGQTSRSARPVTLLLGLSNNVLCHGSLMWDARRPNSNYTASVLSAHLAVINAAKRLKRGALDLAIAGGCSDSTEEFRKATLIATNTVAGYANGTAVADGAAFITLERREAALARGYRILASYMSSAYSCDGLGPACFDPDGKALYDCIIRALSAAAVKPSEIGLIFSGSSGIPKLDMMEIEVLGRVFAGAGTAPALADTSRVLGGLMEAGGMLDLALVSEFFNCGVVPLAVRSRINHGQFTNNISPERPFALALRCSTSGEYSCVIVKGELN
jgi:3-oxoacyl-(acyl-carrier-protein) synthase